MKKKNKTNTAVMKESSDGWELDGIDDLQEVMSDIYDTKYEIDNCVRGCYTGCHTYAELAEHLRSLADRLTFAADDVSYIADDGEEPED